MVNQRPRETRGGSNVCVPIPARPHAPAQGKQDMPSETNTVLFSCVTPLPPLISKEAALFQAVHLSVIFNSKNQNLSFLHSSNSTGCFLCQVLFFPIELRIKSYTLVK